jgi:hypothetical protein
LHRERKFSTLREESKTVTEGFVECCEEGNFGALEKAARKP